MTTALRVREDYRICLRARTPVHVGAAAADAVADLPMAADGLGRLIIPGSSWAGVLRALTRQVAGEDEQDVFGFADGDEGQASGLSVFDSVLPEPDVALRTGVGIDRRTATAARALLYDRLVVQPGQQIVLEMRYEGPASAGLRALVAHVRANGLTVGAASSRGLGRLDCTEATVCRTDLRSRADILALLGATKTAQPIDPATAAPATGIRLDWRPRMPLVVGASAAGASAQLMPLMTRGADGGLVPVLPGSSVKGVLRAQAERVVRTLLGPGADPTDDPVASADALAARVPLLAEVFGSRHRAGALRIPDVTARLDTTVTAQEWARQYTEESPQPPPWASARARVTLDRWTAGAADARLYTTLEPRVWEWEPLVLELDPARIPSGRLHAVVVLLGVAAAPLVAGSGGFGRATTRGLGEIEVRGVEVTGLPGYTGDWWDWLRHLAGGADLDTLLGLHEQEVTA